MPVLFVPFFVFLIESSSAWNWLRQLGGVGLVLLGILDSSVIPTPGSLDILTILLAARQPDWWLYYAGMATVGGVLGGYLTFRLGRKGGKEMLERKFPRKRVQQVYRKFEKHSFLTVLVPALLPPPFPLSPFLVAAGALKCGTASFLSALALGRAVRFAILAYLASRYANTLIGAITKYQGPVIWTLVGLGVAGGIGAWLWFRKKRHALAAEKQRESAAARRPSAA